MNDEQLRAFASGFRDGILEGRSSAAMCFAVCAPLQSLLQLHGVKAQLVRSDLGYCEHYWLRLADGRALDPTGDQFNVLFGYTLPPVYLGDPVEIHKDWEVP